MLYSNALHWIDGAQVTSEITVDHQLGTNHNLNGASYPRNALLALCDYHLEYFILAHWISNSDHSIELNDVGMKELPHDGCFL